MVFRYGVKLVKRGGWVNLIISFWLALVMASNGSIICFVSKGEIFNSLHLFFIPRNFLGGKDILWLSGVLSSFCV